MNRDVLPVSGILLAGGNSRRMGVNKLLLPWNNGNLLSNAIRILQSRISDICIVGDSGIGNNPAIRFLEDTVRSGPLNGILTGLQAMQFETAFVMASDLPFVTPPAIEFLIQNSQDADVTIIRTDDGCHPLFGVYQRSCIKAIRAYMNEGNRKVTGFWPRVTTRMIDVGCDPFWKRSLININNPDDYQKALTLQKTLNECPRYDESSA